MGSMANLRGRVASADPSGEDSAVPHRLRACQPLVNLPLAFSRSGVRADTTGMSVTPSQFELLGSLLDAASLRHQVIAQNVANVNTPGYRRLDVSFEESLNREMLASGDLDNSPQKARIIEGASGPVREDGNNVDVDAEMGRLNKNTMLFNVYSQILATRISAMRSAITGR